MSIQKTSTNHQAGAVSLFIVIFTAILLAIATVGFIRIMISDQRQASIYDVSQSAYDAAQAGVEDAKRALLIYQSCQNGETSGPICTTVANAIKNKTCDTLAQAGVSSQTPNGETLVQQTSNNIGEKEMSQAYTCVKIIMDIKDYLGQLDSDASVVVPLTASGGFKSIRLSWFNIEDIPIGSRTDLSMEYPSMAAAQLNLPLSSAWGTPGRNVPPLMRAQVIQIAGGGNVNSFNNADAANTVFLYPSTTGVSSYSMSSAGRQAKAIATFSPQRIKCQTSLATGGYACTADIIPDTASPDKTVYLHLTSLYRSAHFKVEFVDGADQPVQFSSPQVEVDSTGRASNVFRRVSSRVELAGRVTYPDSALSVSESLCKDYIVSASKYRNDGCN